MALSRPCSPSRAEMAPASTIPTPAAIAAAGAAAASEVLRVPTTASHPPCVDYDEELIRMRADLVCTGCRCGWLCCDCNMGCFACKQRRRHCYCWYVRSSETGDLVRMHCEVCVELRKVCKCHLTYRCKWCLISMNKCRRGGCIVLLPCRLSAEAAPYVDLFSKEDTNEEDDRQEEAIAAAQAAVAAAEEEEEEEGEDMVSLTSSSPSEDSDTASLLTWTSSSTSQSSSESSASLSTSTWSVASSQQEEWWQSQRVGLGGSQEDESLYGSTYTISSVSSGGSYNSVGGKSDF